MAWHVFAIRLIVGLLLGALIGAERQWRQRMAGLRTNALVAAGAGMFVMLSALAVHADDSFRIAGQVVSGIGFLGAGVILRNGLNITGLNTAATLWLGTVDADITYLFRITARTDQEAHLRALLLHSLGGQPSLLSAPSAACGRN
jgi:hypothetical protein